MVSLAFKYVPQPATTTSVFSSVFILLLWYKGYRVILITPRGPKYIRLFLAKNFHQGKWAYARGERILGSIMGTILLEMLSDAGGVLGFWGGVGSMGTLFLVILMTQKYCCRSSDNKDDSGWQVQTKPETYCVNSLNKLEPTFMRLDFLSLSIKFNLNNFCLLWYEICHNFVIKENLVLFSEIIAWNSQGHSNNFHIEFMYK